MGVLRLLLALSVVMNHGLTTLFGSRLIDAAGAVWVFFAISGFLITVALDGKYSGGLRHFYWNRALRLYPSYWAWLLVTIAAYVLLPHSALTRGFHEGGSFQASGFWEDHFHLASFSTVIVAFVANLTGLLADSLLSLGLDPRTGHLIADPTHAGSVWAMAFMFIGQYWSIGVELIFYALAPALTKRLGVIAVVFLLSASGYAERVWVSLPLPPALTYMSAPRHLWIFMLGAALARAYLARKDGSRHRLWMACAVCILMYLFVSIEHARLFVNPAFPWWEFAMLTAAVPFLFALTGKNRFDRFAGDLSYPVYVNHFLIIQIVSSFVAPNGALYAALSIAVAAATVMLIERPSRRFRWRAAKQVSTAAA